MFFLLSSEPNLIQKKNQVATRPVATSNSYRNGITPYTKWCKVNGISETLTDHTSEEYTRFMVKDARLIASPEKGLSFKTCKYHT